VTPAGVDQLSEYTMQLKDFINEAETALVGRENGRNLRVTLRNRKIILENLETANDKIKVVIPPHIVSMNRSFFLGAFADRARALGKQGFINKYNFDTSEHIGNKIKDHIDYAIKNASPEDILDV
jgi:hypothetical protein